MVEKRPPTAAELIFLSKLSLAGPPFAIFLVLSHYSSARLTMIACELFLAFELYGTINTSWASASLQKGVNIGLVMPPSIYGSTNLDMIILHGIMYYGGT